MKPAKPFLRWAGGKGRLLPKLLPYVPQNIYRYWEPFLGGGAMFWHLANERRFTYAVLSDANVELINCYVQVRDDVEAVVKLLKSNSGAREEYEAMAQATFWDPVNRAARFIYLNRCGFNGLWRVNARGEYNVPFGRRSNGKPTEVCPTEVADNLRSCSAALKGVEIVKKANWASLGSVYTDDFVFIDPPYLPEKVDSFTSYTAAGFSLRDHGVLANAFARLDARHAVLCSSDTPVARAMYRGLTVKKITAPRSRQGQANAAKSTGELIVLSRALAEASKTRRAA